MRAQRDTVAAGPYALAIRQLRGPAVAGGDAVVRIERADGRQTEARRPLVPEPGTEAWWVASLADQPPGSVVHYHFELRTADGSSIRHPRRAPAAHRFRVVAARVESVELATRVMAPAQAPPVPPAARAASRRRAKSSKQAAELRLRLAGRDVRRVTAVVRPPYGAPGRDEQRIALGRGTSTGESTSWLAPVPQLAPGDRMDVHFEIETGSGLVQRLPSGAPRIVLPLRRPLRRVVRAAGIPTFAAALAPAGEDVWVGLRGGGLLKIGPSGTRRWDLGSGLPSGAVRAVARDPASGRLWLGTEAGLALLDPGFGAPARFLRLRDERGGGVEPLAVSPLDGMLLLQREGSQDVGVEVLSNGAPAVQRPHLGSGELLALTTAGFDAQDGCWLLGALLRGSPPLPAALRACGERTEVLRLATEPGGRFVPRRVVALARDPGSGDLAAAVEYESAGATRYGVFRVPSRGSVTALAAELAALDAEVTALASDWERGRLLVGTLGAGGWLVDATGARRIGGPERARARITALAVDAGTGTVWIGTDTGVDRLAPDASWEPLATRASPAVPLDARPQAVSPDGDRVLLSSHAHGLLELARLPGRAARWELVRQLRPGAELPAGALLGDAGYTGRDDIVAVLRSQGVLVLGGSAGGAVLGPEHGLSSPHVQRLLVRAGEELWIAHTPFPESVGRGASIQILVDERVERTFPVSGAGAATVAQWLEVPGRGTVFAATRAGVVEIDRERGLLLRSGNPASAVAHDPTSGQVGAVGSAVERLIGDRFEPVLFRVDHPDRPRGKSAPGSPIALAIGPDGVWHVLYGRGIVALVAADGRLLGVLDAADGIPHSARQLLVHPASGDVLVGSRREGVVAIEAP